MRIGVFDSGLGGLTVFRALRNALPTADLLYLGDTARTPYGSKGEHTILRYSRECADFLCSRSIDALVIACNTSSAIAIEELKKDLPLPVFGTIDAAVGESMRGENASIGIIATHATIAKGAYQRSIAQKLPRVEVIAKACPLFVPLVENGILSGPVLEATLDLYLAELREKRLSTLILGCTHYPFLRPAFERYFHGEVRLIDCADAVAREVAGALTQEPWTNKAVTGRSEFYVTDEPSRFDYLARVFFEQEQPQAVQVEELATHRPCGI
ncbi:MAG: glutamate racemase [Bdellovibrionota bacterium]|nr:MAG: glutamate racemase [Bdellovibrionota bacterium]